MNRDLGAERSEDAKVHGLSPRGVCVSGPALRGDEGTTSIATFAHNLAQRSDWAHLSVAFFLWRLGGKRVLSHSDIDDSKPKRAPPE
jgi:hypothetical protein